MTFTVGIDSGSTTTKGILLQGETIVRRFLCPTSFRPATSIVEAWETLCEGLGEKPFLTLTGYGRQLVDFADKRSPKSPATASAHVCCSRKHVRRSTSAGRTAK